MTEITDDMVHKALHWWYGNPDESFYDYEEPADMRKALEAESDEEAILIWIPIRPNGDDLKVMSEIRQGLLRTGDLS